MPAFPSGVYVEVSSIFISWSVAAFSFGSVVVDAWVVDDDAIGAFEPDGTASLSSQAVTPIVIAQIRAQAMSFFLFVMVSSLECVAFLLEL